MTNFEDERVSFRIDTTIKKWLSLNGGSKFIRKLIIEAYEEIEQTKYDNNNEN